MDKFGPGNLPPQPPSRANDSHTASISMEAERVQGLPVNSFTNFPDWLLKKWQRIADLLADLLGVKAALIMKIENEYMEVFISSHSQGNPYHVGDKEKWYGLYCETVIKTQSMLLIPDAARDEQWNTNPDIKLGMIAYLGFPINFPDTAPFGTLCVLDNKERPFSTQEQLLLSQFRNVIELDLALVQSFELKTHELAKTIRGHLRRSKCLSASLGLVAEWNGPLDEFMKSMLALIPSGWESPQNMRVKIIYQGREFASPDFRESAWGQTVVIRAARESAGTLEVYALEETSGSWSAEDSEMIQEIARQIGLMLERHHRETALKEQAYFPVLNPGLILCMDAAGQVTLANPTAVRYGLQAGLSWQQIVPGAQALDLPGCIRAGLTRVIEAHIGERIFQLTVRGVAEMGQAFVFGSDITEREQARKKVYDALVYNRSLIEASLDPLVTIGLDGKINDVNAATEQITGFTRAELTGTDFSDYFTDPQQARAGYRQVFREGAVRDYPLDIRHRDGHSISVLYNASVYRNSAGFVAGVFAAARDITELNRIQAAEREHRALAEALRDTAAAFNSTLQLDEVLDCIVNNIARVVPLDAANIMLVKAADQMVQVVRRHSTREADSVTAPQNYQFSFSKVRNLREIFITGEPVFVADTKVYDGWVITPPTEWVRATIGVPIKIKGEVIGILAVYSATPGSFTPLVVEHLQAFAEQAAHALENARLYEEVQELAITDTLTGLFNRRGLVRFGEREFERARRFQHPLSVAMLDLDLFKRVNDTYGHATGDRVLQAVARCCRAHVRNVDMVVRYGGEEFILLLPETDLANAAQIAERVRESVEALVISAEADENLSGSTVKVTASLGVTSLTAGTPSLTDLLVRADQALYTAKQAGRNRVVVESQGG